LPEVTKAGAGSHNDYSVEQKDTLKNENREDFCKGISKDFIQCFSAIEEAVFLSPCTFTDGIYLLSLLFSRFVKEKVCCFFSTGLENFGSRRSEK
jgi:hypothetical protein